MGEMPADLKQPVGMNQKGEKTHILPYFIEKLDNEITFYSELIKAEVLFNLIVSWITILSKKVNYIEIHCYMILCMCFLRLRCHEK